MSRDTTRSVAAAAVALLLVAASLGAVAPIAAGASDAITQETSLAIGTEPATGTANGTARLPLSLTNEGEARSVGPVLRIEDLPPGFAVVNQSSPNGTYRESTREWLWTRVDSGETVTATAVLAFPANASGSYEVSLSADDADNATATATATVRVEEEPTDGGSDGGTDSDSEADGADGTDGAGENGDEEDGDEVAAGSGSGSIPLVPVAAGVLLLLLAVGVWRYRRWGDHRSR